MFRYDVFYIQRLSERSLGCRRPRAVRPPWPRLPRPRTPSSPSPRISSSLFGTSFDYAYPSFAREFTERHIQYLQASLDRMVHTRCFHGRSPPEGKDDRASGDFPTALTTSDPLFLRTFAQDLDRILYV